ncbi:hypothetical protein EDB85DRAFT_1167046 [Lactarius pseudohatsudake]|nr:hypothetical protein EDB85DRAFT_1167046 [Lactarius pseudohatsudake]
MHVSLSSRLLATPLFSLICYLFRFLGSASSSSRYIPVPIVLHFFSFTYLCHAYFSFLPIYLFILAIRNQALASHDGPIGCGFLIAHSARNATRPMAELRKRINNFSKINFWALAGVISQPLPLYIVSTGYIRTQILHVSGIHNYPLWD